MDESGIHPAFDTVGLFDADYLYLYATRDPSGEPLTVQHRRLIAVAALP